MREFVGSVQCWLRQYISQELFKGGQETNCRLNNLIYHAACTRQSISLWFLQTADYKVIEAAIRAALRLAWNRV